jgi:hypothetical protein
LVGAGLDAPRLVAAPFLAAADRAAAVRPDPAGRRALFPFDPFDPADPVDPVDLPRPDPPAPPRPPADPLPPRPLVPVPPPRPPDRLVVVRAVVRAPDPVPSPVLREAAAAEPLRAPPDLADPAEPRLAPLGGTLGKITSGDSSL